MPEGTVKEHGLFDAQQDAEILRKAMKGLGTDEKSIIDIIAHRTNKQRQEIKTQFKQMFGKDLLDDLKSELSGNLEEAILALLMLPDEFDAWSLHGAMAGLGTTESTLIEIMSSRSNQEIKAITAAYKKLYKKDLAKELQSDTSGCFKRLMFSLAQAARLEDETPDPATAAEDAKALYDAGEGKWGTDESRFNVILASRSFAQLPLIFDEYEKISKKSMEDAIKSEFSGDIEDGMLAIVKCARSKPMYFAERLHKAMKGLGTNDKALIRILVSRSEIDLVQIKDAFKAKYNQELEEWISGDCSGDYKKLLLHLVRGN